MASRKAFEARTILSRDTFHNGFCTPQLRPLFILPLFANVIIIASVSALCGFFSSEIYDESQFPLPHWVFFASSVVFAPTMIALCKVLPDPSYSLCAGGVISTIGLISAALAHGHKQMVIFAILVGAGVTLSLTSASVSLAPYFVQRSKRCAMLMLLSVAIIMVSVHSAIIHLVTVLQGKTFVILSPVVFITSVMPLLTKLWFDRRSRSDQMNRSLIHADEPLLDYMESAKSLTDKAHDDQPAIANEKVDSVCHCIKQRFRSMTFQDGWLVSIVSVMVWLFWGAGVDSTWYSMLSTPHTDSPWLSTISKTQAALGQNVILIQLLLSMIVLVIKIITEPKAPSLPSPKSSLFPSSSNPSSAQPMDRLVFGCNYMFLGLLGVGGLLVAFCPDYTIPFHNHLLFSIGFALQFDDLCDLKAEDDDDSEQNSPKRPRVIYGITLKQLDRLEPRRSGLEICCLVCHILSLLMMSCLAMLLGLQVSNGMIYVIAKSPVAYLFSNGGLIFVSTVSVALSLAQPDTWV